MQRFRLMNIYLAAAFVLVGAAIVLETSRKPAAAAAQRTRADSPADAAAMKPPETALRHNDAATQVTVAIDNFKFAPRELSLAAGSTVTWINHDDVPHTATSVNDPPAFDSRALDTDDKYSFTFTKPGTYAYFCKVHPHMTGMVIVK